MTQRGSRGAEPGGWDWEWVRKTCWEEARRILGPGAAADDAAQEAAIKAWRHHASCRTPEHPRPWLAAIARRDRRLLLARYWADMTQDEVANLLGMPDGTAKVRLHRLRARLRPTLREP